MKTLQILLLIGISLLILCPAQAAQNTTAAVPKYDKSTEAVFKGVVQEVA